MWTNKGMYGLIYGNILLQALGEDSQDCRLELEPRQALLQLYNDIIHYDNTPMQYTVIFNSCKNNKL